MPAKHSRHIALTGSLAAWIDSQIAAGEYTSTSDLIRTAIRVLRTQSDVQTSSPSETANHKLAGLRERN